MIKLQLRDFVKPTSVPIYATWQEASAVAIAAGVKSYTDYRRRYQDIDPRLPGSPSTKYRDFPNWYVFVGKTKPIELYATWQEASKVAIAAGVKGSVDYRARYRKIDSRLPSNPHGKYSDFPNWYIFLGKPEPVELYATWQEASKVVIAAGVKSMAEYKRGCRQIDPRLPMNLYLKYPDFPGFLIFLGKDNVK